MDELTAVRQMLAEQPPPEPDETAMARARLNRAMAGAGIRRWLPAARQRRIQVMAGLIAAVATGLIIAVVTASGGLTTASALTVRQLAERAAAAASRGPEVRPWQWVFWKETADGGGVKAMTFHVWMTANAEHAAWVYKGKTISLGKGPFNGPPEVDSRGSSALTGKIPVSYAELSALPHSPLVLDRYLGRLHLPGWGATPFRVFYVIGLLLSSYVLPPGLIAELYQALGEIPGVTVDNHAKDVAGRHGVAFYSQKWRPTYEEIILNSRTYHLMGIDFYLRHHHYMFNGVAILRQVLVSRPGVTK